MTLRTRAWAILLFLLLVASGGYAWATPNFDAPSLWRVFCFALIGLLGFAVTFVMPTVRGGRSLLLLIWIPALLVRICLLPTAPSDDVHRYLWEGKLVTEGVSPYSHTADAEELIPFRDQHWALMNHKDKPTAYPPLALGVFAFIGALWYHPMAFKLFFVLADLLAMAGVLKILRQRGLSMAYAGFYAFNPLILVSYAGEAHFDSLMVAPLVWALVWTNSHLRGISLALSVGIKWITLPLLPFLVPFKPRYWSGYLAAGLVLLGPALFFWDTIPQLIKGLVEFGSTRSFNGPVYWVLLEGCEMSRTAASLAVAVAFGLIFLWRWWWHSDASADSNIRWVLGALVVLSPTVHFWYLAWLIPFVALRPSLPWLALTVSASAYFFVWINYASTGFWGLRGSELLFFWLPFVGACLYELWSTRGVCLRRQKLPKVGNSIGVVLPTLNAESTLRSALQGLAEQSEKADVIVVVDGGSTDGTVSIAEQADLPVQVVHSAPGRGRQVAKGIQELDADWAIILHADVELDKDAIAMLKKAVSEHPEVIGGALGQRFQSKLPELLLIELLNDMRAMITRTAFGDQVQFMRVQADRRWTLMPNQPLMEDVESSWRMRTKGAVLFLNQPCRVGSVKWSRQSWFKRVRLVVSLLVRYRLARARGLPAAAELSERLYREYYS